MPGEGRISSQTGHWTISIKNLPGYRGASTASAKRAWCMPASRENAWSMNIWCVISLNTKCWEVMSDMGSYYQCSDPDSNEKNLDRSYPSIKHKQKWVWGDRPWKHFPSAGRKTCIWKVSVYSQLGDQHRNIVPVGLLLEQGTPWTGLSGAVKGGHHQYCKSTWSTQLICNIVNETDNPAGNLPDCTKMPMTQNLADLWHGSKSD